MLRLNYLIATLLLVLNVEGANATTFDVSASFGNTYHPALPLTGTFTVDPAGVVANPNLVVTGFSAFSTIVHSYTFFVGTWTMTLANASGNILDFSFDPSPVPSGGALVGLTSGAITGGELYVACSPQGGLCRTWDNWSSYGLLTEYFGGNSLRGNITSEVSATPLPAALPLFATGLGALGWLARRRKRKAVAPAVA